LREEELHVAAAHVAELLRERVDRRTLHRAGRPFQRVVGEQRPAAEQAPAGDVGVGLHHLLDLRDGVLRRLFVEKMSTSRMLGYFFAAARKPAARCWRFTAFGIAVDGGDHAFAVELLGQRVERRRTRREVVDADGDEALARRGVAQTSPRARLARRPC